MNVKLFGYSISINVLILIGILYLIMVVNALSASCNMEGLTDKEAQGIANAIQNEVEKTKSIIKNMPKPLSQKDKQGISDRLSNLMSMASRANNARIANYVQKESQNIKAMISTM
jgi:hypothetical protein